MTEGPPERALLIRLSSIGDVIHTLPAFMALRRSWPSTLLGWAVEPAAAPLVQRLPGPLLVHVLDTQRWRQAWCSRRTVAEMRGSFTFLRRQRYELALDFQGLLKSAVVGALSGAPIIGYARANLREPLAARFYRTSAKEVRRNAHVIRLATALAEAAGVCAGELCFPPLTDRDDEAYVDARLHKLGVKRFMIIHAASNWPSKRWPPLRFAGLGRALIRRTGLSLLWTWGPGERSQVEALATRTGNRSHLAFPTTLTQLAALLSRASLFVGGDSAPLHLAAACETPVVGLFGPTDPSRNGSWSAQDSAVFTRLPCSFCHQRRCPIGTRQCLQELSIEAVAGAAEARLQAPLARTG
ncbi:MAG: glycosyltransferase family 9 protein [Acidobacteriota bacterium]